MQTFFTMAFKNWCFTLHDYTQEQYDGIEWGVFGGLQGEIAPDTGRKHLQGFFVLEKKQRLSYLKKNMHSSCHFEVMKGSIDDSIKYCSKEDSACAEHPYRQWGEKPVSDAKTVYLKVVILR